MEQPSSGSNGDAPAAPAALAAPVRKPHFMQIEDLQVGFADVIFVVVRMRMPLQPLGQYEPLSWVIADSSGRTVLNISDGRGSWIEPGDVVQITGAYGYVSHGEVVLCLNTGSEITKLGRCIAQLKTNKFVPDDFMIMDSVGDPTYIIEHFTARKLDDSETEEEVDNDDWAMEQ